MTNYPQQDYEKDKAIIVDAPEGATHYDDENNYWILTANQNIQEKVFETSKNKWVNCPIKGFSFQSLNDLRQKIALYEQWKYYQDLLKESGFDGITDLLVQHKKSNERISELESEFERQMTKDFVTIADQAKRITELEKALKPDLFWPVDDTEMSFDSVEELLEYHYYDDLVKGVRITVQQAAKLPDSVYQITSLDADGNFEVAEVKDE